jgi:hypothetical protein
LEEHHTLITSIEVAVVGPLLVFFTLRYFFFGFFRLWLFWLGLYFHWFVVF